MRSAARLIFGIAAALAACGPASLPLAPEAAILPETAVAEMLHQCSRGTPPPGEAAWTPAPADVAALEAALPNALHARREISGQRFPGDPDWSRVPQGWRRQYIGIVRGGRRFIYGNLFPLRPNGEFALGGERWKTAPIVICDGGPVIFGVEYDVEAGRFTQIAFNGNLG